MHKWHLLAAGMALTLLTWASVCQARDKEVAYHDYIIEAGQRHQVDPALIKAIIQAESGYNPKAVSRQGAKGLMQLMPDTAKELGVQDIFDPQHNIEGGVKYFRFLMDEFDGEVRLALAAYNAGLYKVKKYDGVPPFNATRRYIQKVMKYYRHYIRQQKIPDQA